MVSNGQNGGKPPVGPPPSYGGSVMAQPQRNLGATVGRMPTQYGGLLPVARPTNMQKRLQWIGHVIRMKEDRLVKKALNGKIEGLRRRGWPRTRWLDAVENDLREMKVKRWRKTAEDSEAWATIMKEAKVLRGPQLGMWVAQLLEKFARDGLEDPGLNSEWWQNFFHCQTSRTAPGVSGYTSSQPSTTTSDSLTTTTTGNFDFLSPLTIPASLAGDTQTGGGAGLDCNALSEGLESLKYSTLEFPGIKGKVTEAFREFKEVPSTANQNQASSSSVASQENVHSTSVNFTFPLLQGQLLKVTGDGTVQPVSSKIPSQSTNSNIGMSKTGNTPQIVGVIKFNVGSSGIPLTVATSSNSSNCSKIVNNQNLNVISSNGPILITHQPMIPNVLYQSQVFNP
ncbi:hypothetical protein ANN_24897 [Periplaneta americana]|uniref:Uncharacterized protein n=1 Tax=Periplaneta americana TaxID=6978 RepID=A0ABQ8S061_PERAM|nr:hypothetical protein ANN_24897 [Periplaneta americana]